MSVSNYAGEAPVIETERLRLRPHHKNDLKACELMWSDPGVNRYIGGRVSTEQEVWARIMTYLGHWLLQGYGYWAVEEKATGNFIGELGFADFKRDIDSSLKGIPELGWVLTPSAQGKGYATEGVLAAVEWGNAHFARTRTTCMIEPANLQSIRVAEKCGYRQVERMIYRNTAVLIFDRELGVG
jgi:RimJ/RimL family protein N-acetyltransferase